ncbi:MAG TPA: tyrosine-type recombinase/integrase [Thermodesulfobacteriota bacterium]|nr:tyrosine-type recombinase/integrase [Thermodesulfobacteriota bacterium]
MALILYCAGLRLSECRRLRVKNVDLGQNEIPIRNGKEFQDRSTILQRAVRGEVKKTVCSICGATVSWIRNT